MSLNHSVVWLDHSKAQIIHFSLEESASESVKSGLAHQRTHERHADVHAPSSDNKQFFNDIAATLKAPHAILIVGPAEEKLAFSKHLTAHVPAIAEKVKGVETVDHPTEGQLLAYAREYFLKAGELR